MFSVMYWFMFYALKRSNQLHKLYTAVVLVLNDKLCDIWLCHSSDLYRLYVALLKGWGAHSYWPSTALLNCNDSTPVITLCKSQGVNSWLGPQASCGISSLLYYQNLQVKHFLLTPSIKSWLLVYLKMCSNISTFLRKYW